MQSSTRIRELASDLIANTPHGEPFDARELIRQYPELKQVRSVVLQLAFEEYCRRVEEGERVVSSVFAGRFGSVERSLLRAIEVEKYLQGDPELGQDFHSIVFPEAGSVFLEFELLEEIGKGALSRVFIAAEGALGGRTVVAKICQRGGEEANKLGQLEHPGVVPIHSVQRCPTTQLWLICMPLITRATLFDAVEHLFRKPDARPRSGADLLAAVHKCQPGDGAAGEESPSQRANSFARRSFPDAVTDLGLQVAEALEFTHQRGIFHCDIKPTNILLTRDGEALLLDFNLSVQEDAKETVLGGTLPYMPPEQLRVLMSAEEMNQFMASAAIDVFSLGATLHELLTGRLPFGKPNLDLERSEIARELYSRQQKQPSDQIVERLMKVADRGLAQLIADCLAFDPSHRPRSASEVADRLRKLLLRRRRVVRWVKSHRRGLGVAAAMLGLAFVGVAQTEAGHYFLQSMRLLPRTSEFEFQANLRRARLANEQRNWSVANDYYERALSAKSDDLQARFERGRTLLRLGRITEASREFQDLADRTSSGVPLAYLGYCHLRTENFVVADQVLRRAWSKGCNDPATMTNWAFAAFRSRGTTLWSLLEEREYIGDVERILSPYLEESMEWRAQEALLCLRQVLHVNYKNSIEERRTPLDPLTTAERDQLVEEFESRIARTIDRLASLDNPPPYVFWRCAAAMASPEDGFDKKTLKQAASYVKRAIYGGYDPQRIRAILQLRDEMDPTGELMSLAKSHKPVMTYGIPDHAVEPPYTSVDLTD